MVLFYSSTPYLQVAPSRECIITFNGECMYYAQNQKEEKLLREYAEATKGSYNIVEAGGEMDQKELADLHRKLIEAEIAEAEEREISIKAEKEKKEREHSFYSALRMSTSVYR